MAAAGHAYGMARAAPGIMSALFNLIFVYYTAKCKNTKEESRSVICMFNSMAVLLEESKL